MLVGLFLLYAADAIGADACERIVGKVLSVEGSVVRGGPSGDVAAITGDTVCIDTRLRIDGPGRVTIELTDPAAREANANRPVITLGPNSSLSFAQPAREQTWALRLLEGWFRFFSPRPANIDVEAPPYLTAGVRGTEFVLHSRGDFCAETGEPEGCAALWVQQGRVLASNPVESVELGGDAASPSTLLARAGQPFEVRELRLTPEDAVNWVIHYLPLSQLGPTPCAQDTADAVGSDFEHFVSCGAPSEVLEATQAIPASIAAAERARLLGLAASRLLLAGDPTRADELLDAAIAADPSASLYAMKSVVALKRNDKAMARDLAERAVAEDADSPDAHLAMSYVEQASFDLPAARRSARLASDLAPEDPLVLARLAELDLALGDSRKALPTAETAVAEALAASVWTKDALEHCDVDSGTPAGRRDRGLARALTVRGLAHLVRIEARRAQRDMQRAICVDDQSPHARLGLGLALIRQGELDAGVRQLEVAAALDPRSALYRSYLGRGYFEQDDFDLAAKEFGLAHTFDPKDPTPPAYNAILLLALNQPGVALGEMRRSIALNENRAPYRSSRGLDEDLAVRGVGLARVYQDLGFQRLVTLEASRALDFNPTEYAAHRLLSDSYRGQPRLEIARASELLQAQLMQPVNPNPIQPSLAFTNLGLRRLAGPGAAAFNEYSPLFLSDGLRFSGSGVAGSDSTWGEELVLSGMNGKAAASAGQFHYQTDGFRRDSALEHDILSVFGQVELTDGMDVQAEYRHRETDSGDRRFVVNPFQPDDIEFRDIDETIARLGMRVAVTPTSDLLASFVDSTRDETLVVESPMFPRTTTGDLGGRQFEAQYLYDGERADLIVGGGRYDSDAQNVTTFSIFGTEVSSPFESDVDAWNAYIYGIAAPSSSIDLTLGIAYERYEDDSLGGIYKLDEVLPKLGISWQATPSIRLRMSGFRSLKRDIAVNQTIEPTALAGTNQLYDDINGTLSDNLTAAIDYSGHRFWAGVEAGRRDLTSPFFDGRPQIQEFVENEQDERFIHAYTYWMLGKQITVSADVTYSHFEQDPLPNGPAELETLLLPFRLMYTQFDGIFASATATYFDQEVKNVDAGRSQTDRDDALLLDAAIGYTNRGQSLSFGLQVSNVFGSDFQFQDDSFRSSTNQLDPLFLPTRTVLAYLSVRF